MTHTCGYIEDMTAILITILVLVSIAACLFLIQWDKEKIARRALENPYDCNKLGHRFEAHYNEEFVTLAESKVMQISTSCLVNQADFNHALRDASRIRSKYVCHVCSVCGKTVNKGDQDNGPA